MLLFISDLHLQEERPRLNRGFFLFLKEQAPRAEALYILGDFFDVWIGDDAMTPFHHQVAAALKELATSGTQVYLMHGNRDFALGKVFCEAAGATLLSDPCVIQPYDEPLLLMHGDLLCTDDIAYQRLRRFFRNPVVNFILRNTPLGFRQQLASKTRQSSQEATRNKDQQITDANPEAIERFMQHYTAPALIHGHTHRPGIHQQALGKRYVLGDWSDAQGWKLEVTANSKKLLSFDF